MTAFAERAESATGVEVSVVIPCLNEADTVGSCVRAAMEAFERDGLRGEVVVADNGSTDGSQAIAEREGARVVPVSSRGYGSALMGGIAAARGTYVVMGDADASYDFGETGKLVQKLRGGFDLVQGCRLPSGGGRVMPGAMPILHRAIGNPMLSWLARTWFDVPVNDVYCGLRGFTRSFYDGLNQRCTGMEFATEMIVRASLNGARIAEVPITLHPDGRKGRASHLRTFRDGWRTLRLYLLYSPRWLFYYPGLTMIALGALGYAIALPGLRAFGVTFDAHTLLFASLAIVSGFQSVLFALFAETFAVHENLRPPDKRISRVLQFGSLEKGIVAGSALMIAGGALLLTAVVQWWSVRFGNLDYAHTMRWVIPGVTMTTMGLQSILASFYQAVVAFTRR